MLFPSVLSDTNTCLFVDRKTSCAREIKSFPLSVRRVSISSLSRKRFNDHTLGVSQFLPSKKKKKKTNDTRRSLVRLTRAVKVLVGELSTSHLSWCCVSDCTSTRGL